MQQRLPSKEQRGSTIFLIHIVIIAVALLMIYPVTWMLSASFKPPSGIFSSTRLQAYHMIVVPQYIQFKDLGWINSSLPLIVPKFLAADAVKIDGCNHFTQSVYTVSVAPRTFLDSTGISSYGQLFAISVLSFIPIPGFFIAFQRLLIEGVATSDIKG